jgi:hypothetical protein
VSPTRPIAVAVVSLGVAALVFVAPAAAWADIPAPPAAAPFPAPTCPGTTHSDPKTAVATLHTTDVIPDLTSVFGDRLARYNAGEVVPLYDFAGQNRLDGGYPPLCGVRYVEEVGGPVSEWMFCTDLYSHTCARMGPLGGLVDDLGVPMAGLAELGTRNPRLDDDQEKVIAFLVRHGHPFTVPTTTGQVLASGVARADGDSHERAALQELIWCVSDDPSGWPALAAVCAAIMDSAEQARIRALVPDVPVVELDLGAAATPLAFGETAVITLRTNLYHQPIDLAATGVAGELTVLSGPATLAPGTITVAGGDPAVSTTVTLGFRATGVGDVELTASTRPVSVQDLGWSQSPGDFSRDGIDCQVFATFRSVELDTLSDVASARFVGLAETGRADAGAGALLAAGLVGAGLLLLAAEVLRRGPGRHVARRA